MIFNFILIFPLTMADSRSSCLDRKIFLDENPNDPNLSMCPERSVIFVPSAVGNKSVIDLSKLHGLILTYGINNYRKLCTYKNLTLGCARVITNRHNFTFQGLNLVKLCSRTKWTG